MSVNGFPWNMLIGQSCIDANTSVTNYIEELMSNLNFITCDSQDTTKYSQFKKASYVLYQDMTTLSTCLLQYKRDLDSLANWVNSTITTLSVVADTSSIQPTVDLLVAFNSNGSQLIKIYDDYLSGAATKMQLATNFTDSQSVGAIVQCADSVISDFQTSVFDQLETIIASQESLLIKTYMSMLEQFDRLQEYMQADDQAFEMFLRQLRIWRQPALSLQAKQVSI